MASLAGLSTGSIPIPDALVPASIFAPDRGVCGDDAGPECFEDGELFNGEAGDHGIDFTNKVGRDSFRGQLRAVKSCNVFLLML